MVFLDTKDNKSVKDSRTWTFDGAILGVMEDDNGVAMAATDALFANVAYFADVTGGSGFNNQGLEDRLVWWL